MARYYYYYYYFIYMDTQDHTNCCVWIYFIPTSLYQRREENHLIWNQIQVLLLHKRPL